MDFSEWLVRRKVRKQGQESLRVGRYVRSMREDIMSPAENRRLNAAESDLVRALASGDIKLIAPASESMQRCVLGLVPVRKFPGFRENVEVIVVAIAVAMAFRTYLIQPFKIPTGSMQPTLYGIHCMAKDERSFSDMIPFRYAKWIVTGQSFRQVRVTQPGYLSYPTGSNEDPSTSFYKIGEKVYKLPKDAVPRYRPGQYVEAGAVLWSGLTRAGDHVFVNKLAWNFRRPQRGEIIVFSTLDIPTLIPGTHYIKRLVGLPGETVAINPPDLIIDGSPVREPEPIARIARRDPGYAGYSVLGAGSAGLLRTPGNSYALAERQYFAMGDNTMNSRDSRAWGPVPEKNLVGPATFVYWPFTSRWGRTK